MAELEKNYDAKSVEPRIYKAWESSGYFNPEKMIEAGFTKPDAKPFTIMMPPPNVTGVLHMGHAMMLTLEDIMIRYKRMQGFRTLWLPGTDHAAIATQSKVEKDIQKKEGKNRHDIGRDELVKRIEQFAKESHDTIISQTKVMGASCDWSREAFTLDAPRSVAVNTMFKMMYDDGLIYRGNRVVNWDPKGQTTIADDEIVYEARKAKLYTFKYSKEFPIAISTTRPETKVGDTAVAVNPADERYAQFIGKEYDAVFCGSPIHIKVIADASVDKEFGTGALGVTPAHSQIDAEMSVRHNLPTKQVINEYAKMVNVSAELEGKKVLEAREIIVAWLQKEGLMMKEEEIDQNVATAERTGGIVEPLPKLQWFVAVNKPFKAISGETTTLKEIMRKAVEGGQITIMPDHFNKIYFNWINNLRDWCISRQIWYGHRIPAWHCLGCGKDRVGSSGASQKLFVARHGETDWNIAKKMQGHTDNVLNETGRKQAQEAAEKLIGSGIEVIFSSDLVRARETAEIIAKKIGAEVVIDARLRERNFGDSEGATFGDVMQKFPNFYGFQSTDGDSESYDAVEKRVWESIHEHSAKHPHKKILFIGHGGTMRVFLKRTRNIAPADFFTRTGAPGALPHVTPIGVEVMDPCSTCGHHFFEQDADTLDTWFSAGMWTFSTLGWPEKTKDLEIYHPTDVLETGYEILFFWVARMIMMSGYALNQIPFKTVYLHGTVRDDKGRKMSKSLGNGIDPLEVADEFGADAGRMALIIGTAAGTDQKISKDKIKGYKHFANKLWNIMRFVDMNAVGLDMAATLTKADEERIAAFEAAKKEIAGHLDAYEFHLAGEKAYHYVWGTFADVVIEESKAALSGDESAAKQSAQRMLMTILSGSLKMLHPFMPFVTEEIWGKLPGSKNLLMVENW
jgi:valyl-tRNA synthetase